MNTYTIALILITAFIAMLTTKSLVIVARDILFYKHIHHANEQYGGSSNIKWLLTDVSVLTFLFLVTIYHVICDAMES